MAGLKISAIPHQRRVGVALVVRALTDNPQFAVEQEHAHLLLRQRRHLGPEQVKDLLGRRDRLPIGRAFGPSRHLIANRQLVQQREVGAQRREQLLPLAVVQPRQVGIGVFASANWSGWMRVFIREFLSGFGTR